MIGPLASRPTVSEMPPAPPAKASAPVGGKTAVLMVVYNHRPDVPSLEVAVANSDRVILVDNGSRPEIVQALRDFAGRFPDQVEVVENGANLGLSKAYNGVIGPLGAEGFDWLYFLDHDATFGAALFAESKRTWSVLEAAGDRVGVVVPIATDDPRLAGTNLGLRTPISELRSTITSGILTRFEVFRSVGGFDERLFTEAADLDFTSRVGQTGRRIVMLKRVLLVQQFGLSPDPHLGSVRLGDRLIRFRSLIRVGIGNSNMYRTKLFYYPERRHEAHLRTLRWIVDQGYPWKNLVRLAYWLTVLEHLYVARFAGSPAEDVPGLPGAAPGAHSARGRDGQITLDR